MKYTPPEFNKSGFNCPYCNVYAHHEWYDQIFATDKSRRVATHDIENYNVAVCKHCSKDSIWLNGKMIYPLIYLAPLHNPDLPKDIIDDYLEARTIMSLSPRGSAAILRLCIQKLCVHLGEAGDNLNHDIGELVNKGLSVTIQKSLDIVRVIGNESVHPGLIDMKDDVETASKLFELVNIIVDVMISQPNKIDDLYNSLPESKKNGIEQRDS